MTPGLGARFDAWQHSVERRVAPNVEPAWAEALLLELRLLGVDGAHIGSALAEVDSHCAESGQGAAEAFGDAITYARSLELPAEQDTAPGELLRSAFPTLVQVVGMLLLVSGFAAWTAGTALDVTVGMLTTLVLLLVALAAAVRWIDQVLRTVVRRPAMAWLCGVPLGLFVAVQLLFPAVALHVPAAWAVAGGATLLVAGLVVAVTRQRSKDTGVDPVVAPIPNTIGAPAGGRLLRLLTHLVTWQIPVATVLLLAAAWWMAG